MALYGTKSVSQAAAIALRQLQDQLSTAYADIAKLQQERSGLRADMQELADTHNSEQQHSDAYTAKLTQQISEMRAMLDEMKDALETTAEENTKLTEQLEQSKQRCISLGQELSASRTEVESAQHQARQMGARLASSQLVAQDAEATCSQQTVAAASAEHNAQKLERKVVDLQWEVEQTQQQLRSKAHHAEHKLKDKDASITKLQADIRELGLKCEAASAQAEVSQPYEQLYREAQAELRQEHAQRVAAQALVEQHKQQLADLKLEASILRQASAEHARQMVDMRLATEKAESFLHHERGMRTALGDALRRTEKSMERVLGLNQSLVDSFTRQQGTPEPHVEDSLVKSDIASPSKPASGRCSPHHTVRVPVPLLPRPVSHTHRPPQPATATHCYTAQQPQRSRHVSGAVSARTCQGRGANGIVLQQTGAAGGKVSQCKGRAVAKKSTTASRALTLRKGYNENLQSRQQVAAVMLSLEDELSVLDLRYADLLQSVQRLSGCDEEDAEEQHEDLSRSITHVLESMQRKGQQIRQLREYCCLLPV